MTAPTESERLAAKLKVDADRQAHALAILSLPALGRWARPGPVTRERVEAVVQMLHPDPETFRWAYATWKRGKS